MTSPQLISVGYEGRSVHELITTLRQQDVACLVDVRLTPISRKPGLSKTALGEALRAAGIDYVHYRDLGNPKDNRDGYRAGHASSLNRYRALLETGAGRTALCHVSELLDGGSVALLCFERDHAQCHRHQVVEGLAELRDGLQVVCV